MARQGAGLGLSISKYVEMLGGKMWVDSKEGHGSTFTLPYLALTIKQRI